LVWVKKRIALEPYLLTGETWVIFNCSAGLFFLWLILAGRAGKRILRS